MDKNSAEYVCQKKLNTDDELLFSSNYLLEDLEQDSARQTQENSKAGIIVVENPEAATAVRMVTISSSPGQGTEYGISNEVWRLIYASFRNSTPLVDYPAVNVEQIDGRNCLIVYIPDPVSGVKGILPERFAGLRKGERIESLLHLPFIRVLPVKVDRDNNIVLLRRDKADLIRAVRYWKKINEGDVVQSVVMGVARTESGMVTRIYLDIEGIRAILPIRELSHNYVDTVNFKRGDILEVKVIKKKETEVPHDIETRVSRRIIASIRALTPDPWELEHCIPVVKMPYTGIVVNIVQTGMFVRLSSGIEVKTPHNSINYKREIKKGDRVKVYPVYVDRKTRRVQGVLRPEDIDRAARMLESINEARRLRK